MFCLFLVSCILYLLSAMALLTITELKPGRAVSLDGEPYIVVASQFGRKSQSKANMQCKLRNLRTGAVIARNFQGSEMVEPADIGYRRVQYLYKDDTGYTFMDSESYDQFPLSEDVLGDAGQYLLEGGEVDALMFEDKPIGIQLKPTVDLKVVETSPGVRGDTATGGNKPAKLASGLSVNVPLFINEGDVIKVNTETGAYMSRVE
jgi:elongation factor P